MRRGVTTPSEPITIYNRKNSTTATNHNHNNNINNQYDHSNSDKRRIDHNNNHNDEDDNEDDDDIIINNNNHHHSHYHDNDNNHDHSIDHILYNRRNTTPINNNHNNNNNDNNDELNRSLHNPLLDDELNRSLHKLTVGGLPSIRRERRYMVSNGNNEFGGHHHEYYQRKSATGVSMGLSAMAIREDERSGIFSTASRSINRDDDDDDDDSSSHFGIGIPIRRGYDNSHRDDYDDMDGMEGGGFRRHEHNIGIMSMARSLPVPRAPFLASRNDEDQLSRIPNMELPENASESLASSVPYGSLNESQFRYPSQLSKSLGSAKYLHHPYNNVISNENSPHTSTSTMNNNSKNNNNEPYYNLQQRVQQMKSNGTLIKNETKSGLAALLGDNNDEQRSSNINNNNKIGSNNTKKATGIGALLEGRGSSNSSMIRDTNDNDSYQPQSQQQQHQQHQSSFPSSIKIGSTSTNTSMLTNSINTARGIRMSVPYSQPIQFQLSNDNIITQTTNHHHQNEHQLSGSLTGLDILKQTPHNRLAKLSPDQTKAMLGIQARSRSYSEDVNTFLSQQQQQVENDSFEDFDGRDSSHHGGHIQRGISDDDSVGEGKDDHHPDIDGAFDLDLDG